MLAHEVMKVSTEDCKSSAKGATSVDLLLADKSPDQHKIVTAWLESSIQSQRVRLLLDSVSPLHCSVRENGMNKSAGTCRWLQRDRRWSAGSALSKRPSSAWFTSVGTRNRRPTRTESNCAPLNAQAEDQ